MIWSNATWLGVVPLALNVVAIFSTGYIARRVGAASFGQFSISLAIAGLSLTVMDFGIRSLAVRDLSHTGPGSRLVFGDFLALRLFTGVVALVLILALAAGMWIWSPGLAPVLLASSLAIVPTSVVGILTDGLVARDLAKATSRATFWSGVSLTIISVVAVALRPTAVVLAASYAIGPLVNFTLLIKQIPQLYGSVTLRWRPRHWRVLLRHARPFYKVGMLGVALGRIETPMIGLMFGEATAGIFSAAISLSDRLAAVIDNVTTAALPTLMRFRGDAQRIADMVARVLHPLLGVLAAGAIMAIFSSTSAVTVVFGADYASGGPALAVALLTLPLIAVNALLFEGFVALRRVEFVTGTVFRGQILTGALLPLLPMIFGLPGVPMARMVGALGVALARVRESRRAFGGVWDAAHLKPLAKRLLLALPIPAVLWWGSFSPLTTVLVAGGGFLVWIAVTAHSSGTLKVLVTALVAPDPAKSASTERLD